MALVTLTKDTWTSIVTTSGETVIQNKGSTPINIATEDTTSLARDGGLELEPGDAVVVGDSLTVKGYSTGVNGKASYVVLKS